LKDSVWGGGNRELGALNLLISDLNAGVEP
jgi:hypothetical protein